MEFNYPSKATGIPAQLSNALIPLVKSNQTISMGSIMVFKKILANDEFLRQYAVIQIIDSVLDEYLPVIIEQFPLQRGDVLELLILIYNNRPSLNVCDDKKWYQVYKKIFSVELKLLRLGHVLPVLDHVISILDNVDGTLLRSFLTEVFGFIHPPYSVDFAEKFRFILHSQNGAQAVANGNLKDKQHAFENSIAKQRLY